MKTLKSRLMWGVLLIVAGTLFLLENLGLLVLGSAWGLLFAAAGAVFLVEFFVYREHWWAAIPGFTLAGLAALIGLSAIFPRAHGGLGAGLFMGSIGLGFLAVYLRSRMREWWAIIPGGITFSLGVLLALEPLLPGEAFAGLFMLGIGGTFALVYLLPTGGERMRWALIPAGILGVIGVLIFSASFELINLVWALAFIALGGWLIFRGMRQRQ